MGGEKKRSHIKANLLKVVEVDRPRSFNSPSAISSRAPKSKTEVLGLPHIHALDGSFIISGIILSNPTKQELPVMQPGHD